MKKMRDFKWRRESLRELITTEGQVISFLCLKDCHVKGEMNLVPEDKIRDLNISCLLVFHDEF